MRLLGERKVGKLARPHGPKSFQLKSAESLLAMLLQNVGKGVRT